MLTSSGGKSGQVVIPPIPRTKGISNRPTTTRSSALPAICCRSRVIGVKGEVSYPGQLARTAFEKKGIRRRLNPVRPQIPVSVGENLTGAD